MFLDYLASFVTWFLDSVLDTVECLLNLPLDNNYFVYQLIAGAGLFILIAFLVRKVVNR